jgi:SAM-dependent methyltransferase
MRDPIPGSFNAVLNLFTSFGYFSTKTEHVNSLKNIFNVLEPGGVFVLDYLNEQYIREHLITHNWESVEGVEFELVRRINGQFIEKDIRITDGGKVKFFQEKVRAFTPEELTGLLEEAGFTVKEQWGSYDLQPFEQHDSRRLIMMCEKSS